MPRPEQPGADLLPGARPLAHSVSPLSVRGTPRLRDLTLRAVPRPQATVPSARLPSLSH